MSFLKTSFLIATTLLVPFALAGTEAAPEVRDAAGDAPAHLDVTKAWIRNTATTLDFTIKLTDISTPLLAGDGRVTYRIEFELSSFDRPLFAEANVYLVENAGVGGPAFGVGASYHGGAEEPGLPNIRVRGSATVNPATDTVVLSMFRNDAVEIPDGAAVIGARVLTERALEPVVIPLAASPIGAGTIADTTGPGAYYVVS